MNNYVNNVMAGLKSLFHSCWINRLSPITLLQTCCIYLVYSVSVSAYQLFVVTCIWQSHWCWSNLNQLSFQVLCTIFSVLSQVCQSNWEWKTILKRVFSFPTSVFRAILLSILKITYCLVYCGSSSLRVHKILPGTGALFAVFDERNNSMSKSHFACEYYNSMVLSKIMEHDTQHYFLHCSLHVSIDKIYYFKHTTNVTDQATDFCSLFYRYS